MSNIDFVGSGRDISLRKADGVTGKVSKTHQ